MAPLVALSGGLACQHCGREVAYLNTDDFPEAGDDPSLIEFLACTGCGALHKVEPDGFVLVQPLVIIPLERLT